MTGRTKMKTIELAKDEASFKILDDWHGRFESALTFETTTQRLETSFGFTDVVTSGADAGPEEETPALVLHGAMAGAPFALGELGDLPGRRSFYAVNIPGQSTRAAQVRLDFRSNEYSQWLGEVMDGLGIDRAILLGVSWGGSVALQMAMHVPDRLAGLVLVVPASIITGPVFKGLFQLALPMMRYRMFPSIKNRDRALDKLVTSQDDLWTPYLGEALRHWKLDFSPPPLVRPESLRSLEAPAYVIAADQDLSFPGRKLLERSKVLFPNLVGTHLLENSRHCPSFLPQDRSKFAQVIERALTQISANADSSSTPLSQ